MRERASPKCRERDIAAGRVTESAFRYPLDRRCVLTVGSKLGSRHAHHLSARLPGARRATRGCVESCVQRVRVRPRRQWCRPRRSAADRKRWARSVRTRRPHRYHGKRRTRGDARGITSRRAVDPGADRTLRTVRDELPRRDPLSRRRLPRSTPRSHPVDELSLVPTGRM